MHLLQEVKQNSSKWMKTKHADLSNFYWQDGYGAFSVNPKGVETVEKYIRNQHEHHGKNSFQEEYRALLHAHKIDFDERYVWD